jgi:type 1 glutamine amidotransferase
MNRSGRFAFAWLIGMALAAAPAAADDRPMRILVFSKTAGYRHASIPDGIALVRRLGRELGTAVDETEDSSVFTPEALRGYRAVVWLSTSGTVLTESGRAAFEAYMRAGGGYVGVHSASDTEYEWPWYGGLLGCNAWFLKHPKIQPATLVTADIPHPSTRGLPARFPFTDEWYNFRNNPAPRVNVLLRIDESSYDPGEGAMGADHPMSWFHEYGGGRVWYTALGHRPETFADPLFRSHLLGGIRWAAGLEPAGH